MAASAMVRLSRSASSDKLCSTASWTARSMVSIDCAAAGDAQHSSAARGTHPRNFIRALRTGDAARRRCRRLMTSGVTRTLRAGIYRNFHLYVVSAFRRTTTVRPFEDLRAALSDVEGRLKPDTDVLSKRAERGGPRESSLVAGGALTRSDGPARRRPRGASPIGQTGIGADGVVGATRHRFRGHGPIPRRYRRQKKSRRANRQTSALTPPPQTRRGRRSARRERPSATVRSTRPRRDPDRGRRRAG